ncbi:MAG: electron transfer flavoprotein subunit alpha [Flavobacteriales bacterium]|jgi:electron transfer flavoprotein beta subunit|nr:electron transfer flavoprotein subunit alpha [Flavobacteriales bacterium]|tara:strand:- start:8039 stop:8782 length:744 start_codon:yes stop_codon:yes gene_type:complete
MNILVCISSVPDTTSPINFNDNKFDTNGITFIINPYDEFCLTKAIFIKEKSGANITVLNVGENTNDSILRKALAIGADKAIRINQKSENSKTVAECIYNYCNTNSFDLIFCGRESIDYNGGKVPGFVASKLNIPFINSCVGLEITNQIIECKREIDNGHEICEATLPALIAGQKGLVEEKDLRIPSMRGIMTARTKPLEVIDDNINNDEKITILDYSKPEKKSDCRLINEDEVEKLVDLLSNEAKVI